MNIYALWPKVHYIMAKNCNTVVFHHHCYPIKGNFIVYIFKISLCGVKRWHSPCLGDRFWHFCVVSGYVQTVRPRRVSGLPATLYSDSHIRVRFGLVLFASSYVPWIFHNWNPGVGQTGGYKMLLPALQPGLILQHARSGHIKIWSLYNQWHFFNRFTDFFLLLKQDKTLY